MSSSEVARRTGLSAQTTSVITRALEAEGLLERGDPVRGRVGKPSVPMSLAPGGAFGFGLRVGRRGADLLLTDFLGQVRGKLSTDYPFPTPADILQFQAEGLARLRRSLPEGAESRVAGIGIGMPHEIWNWLDIVGAPQADMLAWKSLDLAGTIAAQTGYPVQIGNDATLACYGEQVFGTGPEKGNYSYFYVGSFVGGGIVLNGRVLSGQTDNAGAFGSIVVGDPGARGNQLIHSASLVVLEARLRERGLPAPSPRTPEAEWHADEAVLAEWIDSTARALTTAAVSVTAVLDVPQVVIDGGFPPWVRARLVARVTEAMREADTRGIRAPQITAGTLGALAGALGSAYLPIATSHLIDGYAPAV